MKNRQADRRPENEIDLDATGYPTGRDGLVWATYDARQADIIRNALLAQHITCEIRDISQNEKALYLLHIADERTREDSLNFIWRDKSGLRLKPDWSYADGEINKSFEQWLGGH